MNLTHHRSPRWRMADGGRQREPLKRIVYCLSDFPNGAGKIKMAWLNKNKKEEGILIGYVPTLSRASETLIRKH